MSTVISDSDNDYEENMLGNLMEGRKGRWLTLHEVARESLRRGDI